MALEYYDDAIAAKLEKWTPSDLKLRILKPEDTKRLFETIADDQKDKILVGTRAAVLAEAMRADGVIISSDGWGNSNVDFANTCEQLGKRGISVTGLSFSGTVGQFVVTNDYLDGRRDINKSEEGVETNVVGENNVTEMDCRKVAALLKLKMRKKDQ